MNEGIVARVNASGRTYLTHTRVAGRVLLRIGIGNVLTEERHLAAAWAAIGEAAESA